MVSPELAAKSAGWHSSLLQVQRDIWKGHDLVLPSSLFHYTSMRGVQGIVTSKEFWLSDVRGMIDKKDGRYWLDVFRPIITRKSVPDCVKDVFNNTQSFGLGQHWHLYIVCLSEMAGLERQWQLYADESRGCAIELSSEALEENATGGTRYAYYRMLYDRPMQESFAERTIDTAIQLARQEKLTASEANLYWEQYASFMFLTCGVRFKDPDYKHEREWRVSVPHTDITTVRYRADRKISYVPLPIGPGIITGIVKGRSCSSNADELARILLGGGYPQKIIEQ